MFFLHSASTVQDRHKVYTWLVCFCLHPSSLLRSPAWQSHPLLSQSRHTFLPGGAERCNYCCTTLPLWPVHHLTPHTHTAVINWCLVEWSIWGILLHITYKTRNNTVNNKLTSATDRINQVTLGIYFSRTVCISKLVLLCMLVTARLSCCGEKITTVCSHLGPRCLLLQSFLNWLLRSEVESCEFWI